MDGLGAFCREAVWYSSHGMVQYGAFWYGDVRSGKFLCGMAVRARIGNVRTVYVWSGALSSGEVWQFRSGRLVKACHGDVRFGSHGKSR